MSEAYKENKEFKLKYSLIKELSDFLSVDLESRDHAVFKRDAEEFAKHYRQDYLYAFEPQKSTTIVGIILCLIAAASFVMLFSFSIVIPLVFAAIVALSLVTIVPINKIGYPIQSKEIHKAFLIAIIVEAVAFAILTIIMYKNYFVELNVLKDICAASGKKSAIYDGTIYYMTGDVTDSSFYIGALNNARAWLISTSVILAVSIGIIWLIYKIHNTVGKKDANLQYFLLILIAIAGEALFILVLKQSFPTSPEEIIYRYATNANYAKGGVQFGAFMTLLVYVVTFFTIIILNVEHKNGESRSKRYEAKGKFKDAIAGSMVIIIPIIIIAAIITGITVPVVKTSQVNNERGYRIGMVSGKVSGKNDSLTDIVITDGARATAEVIKKKGFKNFTNLKTVEITAPSLTEIGENAFEGCTSLQSIILPSSLTTIKDEAFYGCSSLKKITIPISVTRIGDNILEGCSSLETLELGFVEKYSTTDSTKFRKLFNYDYVSGFLGYGTYTPKVPSTLKKVVVLEGSRIIPAYAFEAGTSIEEIELPEGLTAIDGYAFSRCRSLTSIQIPSTVDTLGENAFSSCESLSTITLPSSITSITRYAFSGCKNLASVTIPATVVGIREYAFNSCEKLTTINYLGTKAQWEKVSKDRNCFSGTPSSKVVICSDGVYGA